MRHFLYPVKLRFSIIASPGGSFGEAASSRTGFYLAFGGVVCHYDNYLLDILFGSGKLIYI